MEGQTENSNVQRNRAGHQGYIDAYKDSLLLNKRVFYALLCYLRKMCSNQNLSRGLLVKMHISLFYTNKTFWEVQDFASFYKISNYRKFNWKNIQIKWDKVLLIANIFFKPADGAQQDIQYDFLLYSSYTKKAPESEAGPALRAEH